jgi:prephenate dehydrogenase
VHWQKITLVGVGLLGGSLGLAIKQRRLASRVEGFVRRAASVAECKKLGVVDHVTRDLRRAVENADLVILCTPLAQMRELTKRMLPALKRGALVTDVGSVKGDVIQEIGPLVKRAGAHFIGGHPMAGGEKTGPQAARADLFEKAVCVLTPAARTPVRPLRQLTDFWRAVGAQTLQLSPEAHDELVSRSSHLPHLLAAALANYVLDPAHGPGQTRLCASGFRDTTRIASGSPEMWRDIALANRQNLSRALGVFLVDLRKFQRALDAGDAQTVEGLFAKAKQQRDAWCHGRAMSPPATE